METFISTMVCLITPMMTVRRVPASWFPGAWYLAGVLGLAWCLKVMVPVGWVLAGLLAMGMLGSSQHSEAP